MKRKVDLEPTRTIFHISWGPLVWLYFILFAAPVWLSWIVLGSGAAVILLLDTLRIYFTLQMDRGEAVPHWIDVRIRAADGRLIRQDERYALSSAAPYIVGMILLLWFYPQQVVLLIAGVNILAWGDPAARVVGKLWGTPSRYLPKRKSWVGVGGFILSSIFFVSLLVVPFLDRFGLSLEQWAIMIVVGAIVGAITEVLSSYLDNPIVPGMDNILISVASATAMWCVM